MSWRQGILIGFAGLCLVLASAIVYISSRVNDFIVETGPSGEFLAARQAARLNDSDSAGAFYAQALAARPGDETLLREALQAHLMAGQMNQAVATAQRIVAVNEDARQARLLLAIHAFKQANFKGAKTHLNKMSKGPFTELLAPNIHLWMALAEDDENARHKAVKRLARASVFTAAPLVQAAQALELNGEINEAQAYYERALQSGGARYVFMVLAYGEFLHRQGNTEKAEKLYDFYDERNLPHPHVSAARARLYEGQPLAANDDPKAGLALALPPLVKR